MSPRRPSAPDELRLFTFSPGEEIEGFRAVGLADPADPALAGFFKSHYEMDMEPRYEQIEHTAFHMAVSMWRDRKIVEGLIARYPDTLGPYVARVRLTFGYGFNYLDPVLERNPKHLTTWGDPANLAACVVDITPA